MQVLRIDRNFCDRNSFLQLQVEEKQELCFLWPRQWDQMDSKPLLALASHAAPHVKVEQLVPYLTSLHYISCMAQKAS